MTLPSLWSYGTFVLSDGSRSQDVTVALMCTVDKENRKAVTGRPISHEVGIDGEGFSWNTGTGSLCKVRGRRTMAQGWVCMSLCLFMSMNIALLHVCMYMHVLMYMPYILESTVYFCILIYIWIYFYIFGYMCIVYIFTYIVYMWGSIGMWYIHVCVSIFV